MSGRHSRLIRAVALVATVALVLVLTSVQWGVPFGGSSSSLSHYSNGYISFSYPAGWHTAAASGVPLTVSGDGGLVLSSQNLLTSSPSCKVFHHANGQVTGTSCGDGEAVLAHPLSPGGVLVTWTARFGGPAAISQVIGSPVRIGGQPATLTVTKGDCSGMDAEHADESLTASVAGYRMDACMRGPGLRRVKAEVQAMLRSVSFRTPRR